MRAYRQAEAVTVRERDRERNTFEAATARRQGAGESVCREEWESWPRHHDGLSVPNSPGWTYPEAVVRC